MIGEIETIRLELGGKHIKLKFLVLVSLYLCESLISKGSAKLEKAEILQMTVDHLKMLQATGGKGKEPTVSLLIFREISGQGGENCFEEL